MATSRHFESFRATLQPSKAAHHSRRRKHNTSSLVYDYVDAALSKFDALAWQHGDSIFLGHTVLSSSSSAEQLVAPSEGCESFSVALKWLSTLWCVIACERLATPQSTVTSLAAWIELKSVSKLLLVTLSWLGQMLLLLVTEPSGTAG